jgi:4-amino-4-deoxy-L-arabinose transferase-like glycosyltransferase
MFVGSRRLLLLAQKNYQLVLILLLAFILRFWRLSSAPPSLNWDEVSHGYNAYSILKTGRDEWGELFPVIFRSYGDFKLPVYIYLTAISEFFFGLTPFAVRFFSAVAGIGNVILTYLFVKKLGLRIRPFFVSGVVPDKYLALTSSLLVAVEPWSLFLSRPAFEANFALFVFLLGILFFMEGLKRPNFIVVSFVFLGLSVWTYNSYRIFTPLMVLICFLIYRKRIFEILGNKPKIVAFLALVCLLFFVPMLFQFVSRVGLARYFWVGIVDQGVISRIEMARNAGGSFLIHNRITYFLWEFLQNYLSFFTPQFLFLRGGSNYQFSIPERGVLYFINMPFFYLGLISLLMVIKERTNKYRSNLLLLISWFMLSPIPASLTRDAPHVLRAITYIPVPMIFTSIGVCVAVGVVRKFFHRNLYAVYLIFLLAFVVEYTRAYFGVYQRHYSRSWQYGYSQLADFLKERYKDYDKIVVTKMYGEPHEFLLFYLKWDPALFREDANLIRFYKSNWYWVDRFDKFYFVNDWEISVRSSLNIAKSYPEKDVFKLESGYLVDCRSDKSRCLLATSPGNRPDGWIMIKEIRFLDGQPVFEIYENR